MRLSDIVVVALCVGGLSLFRPAQCTTTSYVTYEEDAAGTEIGNLSRDLRIDPEDGAQTSFRFMQENNDQPPGIELRESDGLLSTAGRIDREQLCARSRARCLVAFDVVALSRDKFQLVHVEIEVRDVNDHPPRFPRSEASLEVAEDAPPGSRFPLPVALDQDVGENYIQGYDISPSDHFAVAVRDREDGVKFAELVLLRELDRELEDSYAVEVTATDGGSDAKSGSMMVNVRVLDVNDNSPAFEHSSLNVELSEDSPVGHRVLRVRAFDPDDGVNGEVTYALADASSPDVARLFRVDPRAGDVTLRAPVDFEERRSHELIITASDSGPNSAPSSCRVVVDVVDVNDNAPAISIRPMTSGGDGVAYVTEAAAAESFVALISTVDRDSGANGYVRVSLLGHEHFTLQQAYGDSYMIVSGATLDRERIPEYNLTVVAEDLGSPPFKTVRQYTVRVTDENDNPPLFSKALYEVSVLENNVPGSYVTTVVARDPDAGENAKVSYRVVDAEVPGGSSISTYVSVDPHSGSLYTLRSFDREALQQVELVIQAEDSGSPSLSSATAIRIRVVDQNDNPPRFAFPALANDSADVPLRFDAPAGHLALRVSAEDEDEGVNGELSYRIARGDTKLFAIHKDTGEIALRRGLTAEVGDVLEVTIAVTDGGRSPLSSEATVRFVISDTEPSEERAAAVVPRPADGEGPGVDGSLIVIIVLSGGCALLLIAIVAVVVTCRLGRAASKRASRRDAWHGLFDGGPVPGSAEPNIYTGRRSFFHERASPSLDDSCLYEERGGDSEAKMFLPSKHFQATSAWQGDKYCLQVSGVGNTDQLSVKDSGKGDSDFNDSDSDISGDGGKKTFVTFQPRPSTFSAADSAPGDSQGDCFASPPQSFGAPGDAACMTGFSPALAFHGPRSGKESVYGTTHPKPRCSMQTFSGAGTLRPSYLHQQQRRWADVGAVETRGRSANIATVATASEVATVF